MGMGMPYSDDLAGLRRAGEGGERLVRQTVPVIVQGALLFMCSMASASISSSSLLPSTLRYGFLLVAILLLAMTARIAFKQQAYTSFSARPHGG